MYRTFATIGMVLSMVLCALAPPSTSAAAKTVYVSASGAKLQADKSASSKTLATLPIGTALDVKSRDGNWYQVTAAGGKSGWIYRGKVSDTAPASGQSGQSGGLGDLMSSLGGSGISAGTADTSRSIRGLSPEAEEYAKQTGTPEAYRKALDDTLSIAVTDADIEKLLKEGRIGEYAEAR